MPLLTMIGLMLQADFIPSVNDSSLYFFMGENWVAIKGPYSYSF